jgi:hypothetical protein
MQLFFPCPPRTCILFYDRLSRFTPRPLATSHTTSKLEIAIAWPDDFFLKSNLMSQKNVIFQIYIQSCLIVRTLFFYSSNVRRDSDMLCQRFLFRQKMDVFLTETYRDKSHLFLYHCQKKVKCKWEIEKWLDNGRSQVRFFCAETWQNMS